MWYLDGSCTPERAHVLFVCVMFQGHLSGTGYGYLGWFVYCLCSLIPSLVPRPHPEGRDGLVNEVEFLGLITGMW